jgi:type II secretion system protein G
MRKKPVQHDGFTLVEVSITVVIVGILAAIAVPRFLAARVDAKIQKARADLEILTAAVRQLAWDTGKWPAGVDCNRDQSTETWDLSTPAAGLLSATSAFQNWKGAYVRGIPSDPWGQNYFFDPDYRVGGGNRVVVGSFGPNRAGPNLYDSDDVLVILK